MRIVLYDGLVLTDGRGNLEVTPAAYYRLVLPGRELTRRGHEVHLAQRIAFDESARRFVGVLPGGEPVTDVDVILIKHGLTAADQLVGRGALARRFGQVVAHDFDDWTDDPRNLSGGSAAMGKAAWRSLHSGGLIIASTPYIAEQVGPLETPTVVLPTCIDTAAWAPIPAEDVTDGPVLGWSGMISSRRPDLGILRGWLGPFMDEHDLRIIHAGFIEGLDKSGDFARAADIDPDRVMTRTFVPPTACPTSGLMDGVDIGLVPMADRMVSKAKTALKGMEYSARGIPFVASPIDAYRSLDAGRLAGTSLADQSPSAWQAELERLLDPTERLMAVAPTNAMWDIRRHGADWESALMEVAK